ncbi:MAG: hypothetical protein HYZ53_17180 [Planctomycetes bacterium]|nr:hypothetical protein [Planctomycetota bacterium]
MAEADLLERLRALPRLTPAAAYVLVRTYFSKEGLRAFEDAIRQDARSHPIVYRARVLDGSDPRSLEEWLGDLVAASNSRHAFDRCALDRLIRLDQLLHDAPGPGAGGDRPGPFDDAEFQGYDALSYRLRRSNNPIADYYEGRGEAIRGEATQGGSLTPYCPRMTAVPAYQISGLSIQCGSAAEWPERTLAKSLLQVHHRCQLRVLLWPLRPMLHYPGWEHARQDSSILQLTLSELTPESEAALIAELDAGIEAARGNKATILVLPELALSSQAEVALKERLVDGTDRGHPLLTVFGRCHTPSGDGDLVWNEAVLLGARGEELQVHRKIHPFSTQLAGRPLGERLKGGEEISVVATPLGNLCLLICLDLFHAKVKPVVLESHANLLLVPSLSESTSAHRTAAREFGASCRSTFVVNRAFDSPGFPPVPAGASLFRVPRRRNAEAVHAAEPAGAPYLLFSLAPLPAPQVPGVEREGGGNASRP